MARAMVTQYGMSAKLGAVKYGTSDAEPFLGRDMGHEPDYSEAVAAEIDAEMRALIEPRTTRPGRSWSSTGDVLDKHRARADGEGDALQGRHGADLRAGSSSGPPMAPYNGFGKRPPSDQPPVLTPAERGRRTNGSAAAQRPRRRRGDGRRRTGRRRRRAGDRD